MSGPLPFLLSRDGLMQCWFLGTPPSKGIAGHSFLCPSGLATFAFLLVHWLSSKADVESFEQSAWGGFPWNTEDEALSPLKFNMGVNFLYRRQFCEWQEGCWAWERTVQLLLTNCAKSASLNILSGAWTKWNFGIYAGKTESLFQAQVSGCKWGSTAP